MTYWYDWYKWYIKQTQIFGIFQYLKTKYIVGWGFFQLRYENEAENIHDSHIFMEF